MNLRAIDHGVEARFSTSRSNPTRPIHAFTGFRLRPGVGGWRFLLPALAMVLLLTSCVSEFFYTYAVARNSKSFLRDSRDLPTTVSDPQNGFKSGARWLASQDSRPVSITSFDGLRLEAVYLPPERENLPIVILAHGYSATGSSMGGFARLYHETYGYGILVPDARGHGASGGDYIGFGWHDRLDILAWIDWLLRSGDGGAGSNSRIILHGISMGAATVLMASGEPLPEAVVAVVSDCAYTSADAVLTYQAGRMFGPVATSFVGSTSRYTQCRTGYSFEEASALAQVKKTKTPTLFIHGAEDNFVPFPMMQELVDACPAPKWTFVVPDAGHGEAFLKDPQGYGAVLRGFLEACGLPVP